MLEKLNQINWSEVEACYVPGEQIPVLIRQLISIDKAVQLQAVQELFNNVEHQADIFPATLFVVPFLIELLEEDAVYVKAEILDILRFVTNSNPRDIDLSTGVANAVYDGLPVYQRLLMHPDSKIRNYATQLFTSAARENDISLWANEVHKRLNLESDPEIKCFLAKSLGDAISVGQFSKDTIARYRDTIKRLIENESDLYVSTQMGIGLMRLSKRQIDLSVFEHFLQQTRQLENADHPFTSNVLMAVSWVLHNVDNPEGTQHFVQLLETVQKRDNVNFVSQELIDKAFVIDETSDLGNLTSYQKLAVKIILSTVVDWRAIDGYLLRHGLPTERDILAQSI